jgi:hypothetical protein
MLRPGVIGSRTPIVGVVAVVPDVRLGGGAQFFGGLAVRQDVARGRFVLDLELFGCPAFALIGVEPVNPASA